MSKPFVWHSRIRWVDTDASKRIHYTALFRHCEAAEVEFFRLLGRSYVDPNSAEHAYPRVHVEGDYLGPLISDDAIEIAVTVERIGKASYTLGFAVTTAGQPAARARIVIACMDPKTQRSRPLPPDLVAALTPHLVAD